MKDRKKKEWRKRERKSTLCHVSARAVLWSSSWVSPSRVLCSVYSLLEIIDKSRGGEIRRRKRGAEAAELPVGEEKRRLDG